MSVTIDIAGLPAERIRFAPSPLSELCMTLHALSQPAHHPGLASWTTATSAALEPCLADRLLEGDFMWRSSFSDIFMAFAGIPGGSGLPARTLAEELDVLDRLDDERFVIAALEHCWLALYNEGGGPSPLEEPAASRAKALETAAARGPRQLEFSLRLLDDTASVRVWLRRLLEDCDEAFFGETWRRIGRGRAADARHKTELLRHKGLPADAAGGVAGAERRPGRDDDHRGQDGQRFGDRDRSPGRAGPGLRTDQLRLAAPAGLHAPGLACRWSTYPLRSPELASEPGSVELLRRRMEALAHPMRMMLCRESGPGP